MAKPFTPEQIEQLRSNRYTYKVTTSKIFFTAEFKEAFYQKRQDGLTLKETILALGYDPEVLGEKRIDGISHLINKAVREGKGFTEGIKPRTSILDEECPDLTRENFLKMQHELLYMRQELEFLKKFPREECVAYSKKGVSSVVWGGLLKSLGCIYDKKPSRGD